MRTLNPFSVAVALLSMACTTGAIPEKPSGLDNLHRSAEGHASVLRGLRSMLMQRGLLHEIHIDSSTSAVQLEAQVELEEPITPEAGPGGGAGGGPGDAGGGGGPDDADGDGGGPGGGGGGGGGGGLPGGQVFATGPAAPGPTELPGSGMVTSSQYYGAYVIEDEDYGTMMEVELTETSRLISSNGLPAWDWESFFPNPDNDFTVTEQNITLELPLEPTWIGLGQSVGEPGITIFGILMAPGNAQSATCEDGTTLNIEAFNNSDVGFGIDPNGAHIRDSGLGLYHYHGIPETEFSLLEGDGDIIHIGFATDGHMMYYSKSGAYQSSYVLSTEPRSGGVCTYSEPDIPEFELDSMPDGTIVQDWVYTADSGDLDDCNGAIVNGEYAYFITEAYPFIPRCHMAETASLDGLPSPAPRDEEEAVAGPTAAAQVPGSGPAEAGPGGAGGDATDRAAGPIAAGADSTATDTTTTDAVADETAAAPTPRGAAAAVLAALATAGAMLF